MVDRRRFAVEMVVSAYKKAVGTPFMNVRVDPGSKMEENCVEFWKAATTGGRQLDACISTIAALYDKTWCLRTFRRPYPPISIVTGPKAIRHIVRELAVTRGRTKDHVEETAQEIYQMLVGAVGRKQILDVVAAGWPEDEEVRSAIKEIELKKQEEEDA